MGGGGGGEGRASGTLREGAEDFNHGSGCCQSMKAGLELLSRNHKKS